MSLTKNDLHEIETLVNNTITSTVEQLLIPYIDAKNDELKGEISILREEMDMGFKDFRNEMDLRFRILRGDMNEGFAQVHSRIDDAIALNGRYYEECATKKDHKVLEKRVRKLEMAA